jgi:hypothetical protein
MIWISNFIAEHFNLIMIYLVIGVVISVQPLYSNVSEYYKRANNGFIRGIYGEIPLKEKLLMPLVFAISFVAFVLFWPIFSVFFIKDLILKKQETLLVEKKAEESRFLCLPQYLVKQVSIPDVEADTTNFYKDPLGITPSIPFGYLNTAWLEFSTNLKDGEVLWEFLIPEGSEINYKYRTIATQSIRGYAKVHDQKIIGEFVLDDELNHFDL